MWGGGVLRDAKLSGSGKLCEFRSEVAVFGLISKWNRKGLLGSRIGRKREGARSHPL